MPMFAAGVPMSDPRLCSVHLDALPRRQDFRRAREELLGACGQQTLALDQAHLDEIQALSSGRTDGAVPPGGFSLIDDDGPHTLKVGINTIGRLPDNDIPVADGSVSRRHCAIVVHATHVCEVYDTASKNGTFVNGERIDGLTALKTGDKIRLCDRQFVFAAGPSDADSDHTHLES